MYNIIILGKPKSQKRHRYARGFMYDPSSKDKKEIIKELQKNIPKVPLKSDISVELYFHMPYPKKWYRTGKYAGILKDNAPFFHVIKPDVDNLAKIYLDCMNKIIYNDDSQIVHLEVFKMYSEEPKTIIKIRESNEINTTSILQRVKC